MLHRALSALLISVIALAMTRVAQAEPVNGYASKPFTGQVVDALSRKPIAGAVVSAAWTLEPAGGKTPSSEALPQLFVMQTVTSSDGGFRIAGWQGKKTAPVGWRLAPGFDPFLRVYKNGYEYIELYKSADGFDPSPQKIAGSTGADIFRNGVVVHMRRLDMQRGAPGQVSAAQMREWEAWKKHLENGLASLAWTGRTHEAARSHLQLFRLMKANCETLSGAVRDQVCLAENSAVSQFMTRVDAPARQAKPDVATETAMPARGLPSVPHPEMGVSGYPVSRRGE